MDLSCGECDVVSLYVLCCSVSVSVCLACLTVFVNCLVKQFAIRLGVVAILLLNVIDVFSVGGGTLLDRPCMVFQRMCMFSCACDPSVHLSVPSIGFIYVFVCRKLAPHLRI